MNGQQKVVFLKKIPEIRIIFIHSSYYKIATKTNYRSSFIPWITYPQREKRHLLWKSLLLFFSILMYTPSSKAFAIYWVEWYKSWFLDWAILHYSYSKEFSHFLTSTQFLELALIQYITIPWWCIEYKFEYKYT